MDDLEVPPPFSGNLHMLYNVLQPGFFSNFLQTNLGLTRPSRYILSKRCEGLAAVTMAGYTPKCHRLYPIQSQFHKSCKLV
jgi:hypothetical protein